MCKYLINIDFRQSKTDQYLFIKQKKKSPVILLMYIDDSTIIGTRENIDKIITKIKTIFTIKIERELNDFLKCNIFSNKNKNEYWILQNYLVSKLITIFGKMLKKIRQINISGTPRGVQKIINKINEKLLIDKYKKFRSGINNLIYLLKYSKLEFSNTIRELSRYFSGPSEKKTKKN